MAIGKRLGITQHVIGSGGSSCHLILAVVGSHAKGCNMFLFSPLRTHVLLFAGSSIVFPVGPAQIRPNPCNKLLYKNSSALLLGPSL